MIFLGNFLHTVTQFQAPQKTGTGKQEPGTGWDPQKELNPQMEGGEAKQREDRGL